MRLEATIPDSRANAVVKLADELGLSRSQIVDEALALFLKAVVEIRRGRRLVTMASRPSSEPACELATPTLSALEWALSPEKLELPPEALAKMGKLVEAAPRPSPRLRAAAGRQRG
jgi:hypothetical protein